MWWEAEKDPRLTPYLPPGGLMTAAREVLRRLDRGPVQVKLSDTLAVTVGREDFQRDFPRGTNGPALLLSLYYERYVVWVLPMTTGRRSQEVETVLIGPLIDTSLGVTPKREHLLRTDTGTEFLGQWNFDSYLATADFWPTEDVGDEFRNEVVSRIHGYRRYRSRIGERTRQVLEQRDGVARRAQHSWLLASKLLQHLDRSGVSRVELQRLLIVLNRQHLVPVAHIGFSK